MRDGRSLLDIGAAREHDARADRLREDEHVAGSGAALAEDAVGMDEALHGQAEDRLVRPDRVTTADHAAGFGHDGGSRRRGWPRWLRPACARGTPRC